MTTIFTDISIPKEKWILKKVSYFLWLIIRNVLRRGKDFQEIWEYYKCLPPIFPFEWQISTDIDPNEVKALKLDQVQISLSYYSCDQYDDNFQHGI